MHSEPAVFILLPAYLEGPSIREVILNLQKHKFNNIIVVDDGSPDNTYSEVLSCPGVHVTRHLVNRGKGAAVRTGMQIAKNLGADVVVTFDADGQHDPSDIPGLLSAIRDGYDVALGARSFDPSLMPRSKIIANTIGNIATWAFCGIKTSDSQGGLRAYSRKAIDMIDTKTDRYSYEPEVLKEIVRNRLSFTEVPVKTIYNTHSSSKVERQGFINGIRTLAKIITSM